MCILLNSCMVCCSPYPVLRMHIADVHDVDALVLCQLQVGPIRPLEAVALCKLLSTLLT